MQPGPTTNSAGGTMEVVAAAPRCQLLLIVLMAAMLLPGMKGSPLLVQRTVTRTIVLQETIGKEHHHLAFAFIIIERSSYVQSFPLYQDISCHGQITTALMIFLIAVAEHMTKLISSKRQQSILFNKCWYDTAIGCWKKVKFPDKRLKKLPLEYKGMEVTSGQVSLGTGNQRTLAELK
ncbi:hypothetical protein STEG23_008716, partial [Scotinomys teguina]